MPERWEVWLAKVAFEDDPSQTKTRPVLVISETECYILSLKITSHDPRPNYQGEYQIQRLEESGLNRPSTIRTSKRLRLVQSDFVKKLGRLHFVDIIEVRKILSV